ncbi:protein translocase subunit SecD [candidate division KSB1 bacterium]|nr:protein translocase subunit SecD [candidate division KSB1 bacterium]
MRNYYAKIALVVILIGVALYSLYPTVQLGGLQDEETQLVESLSSMTGLTRPEIEIALSQQELESVVHQHTTGDTSIQAREIARKLVDLDSKLANVETKAIRRGLDLQGGTYLVYEADMPKLVLLPEIAKVVDERLEEIVKETQKESEANRTDFFETLQQNFRKRDLQLNSYYGKKGQTDETIITELRQQAQDAISRTLEVIRVRINEFGVSEPSIQTQGNRRIVVELPGIQNIQRAKTIIGSTALLEFKLVEDADVTQSVLNDINKVMRQKRSAEEIQSGDDSETTEKDSSDFQEGEVAEDGEVSLSDLFGDNIDEDSTATPDSSSVLVDEKTYNERPFTSLLRQVGGANSSVITVPIQNYRAVNRILLLPEVQDVIPNDNEFLWKTKTVKYGEEEYQQLYFVRKEAELVGKRLKDARVQISGGSSSLNAGEPEVHLSLDNEGAKKFSRITKNNINKQLGIVLDDQVASAPFITVHIPSGNASITGIRDMEEAKTLALILRAGSLDAAVHVISENTVGPSLGRDSINKGQRSAILGLLIVVLFMIVYYKASGLVADFALLLNILFVFAFLAGFKAVLTLPGIAGIILTVGMAVDANVLIFERIREELRTGKTIRAAIDSGYNRAFRTILDANITTLITAVVLWNFGTSALQGFALTLSIGIIASMFTAIFVTRLIFDVITSRFAITKLSI